MDYRRCPLCALLAAVLLSACQSAYIQPATSAQTARLRVLQLDGDNTNVQKLKTACLTTGQNESNFGNYFENIANFNGISSASDLRRLGMPDPPPTPVKFTEIPVDATRRFLLGYKATRFVSGYPQSMVYTCMTGLSFDPSPGEDYEAVISRDTDTDCRFEFRRLVSSNGAVTREKVDSARALINACP